MSHNVNLHGVKIKDVSVLQQVCEELKAEGTNVEFVGNKTTMRGWGGRTTSVDIAVKMPGYRYDVGFNYDAKAEAFVPVLEDTFRLEGVTAGSNDRTIEGARCRTQGNEAIIGKMLQRYGVVMAERNAGRQGFTTKRNLDATTGQINLEVNY